MVAVGQDQLEIDTVLMNACGQPLVKNVRRRTVRARFGKSEGLGEAEDRADSQVLFLDGDVKSPAPQQGQQNRSNRNSKPRCNTQRFVAKSNCVHQQCRTCRLCCNLNRRPCRPCRPCQRPTLCPCRTPTWKCSRQQRHLLRRHPKRDNPTRRFPWRS